MVGSRFSEDLFFFCHNCLGDLLEAMCKKNYSVTLPVHEIWGTEHNQGSEWDTLSGKSLHLDKLALMLSC